ncbi:MAG: type II toxin-antitoxin system HicA family toxin [bacterium]|nr:type II toxin-antitoxin system HicA family toxin [bacterium]
MSKIPSFKPIKLIRKFERMGYTKDRQKGSHIILYHHSLKRRIVIPMHIKDIPRGTLLSIIKQSGLTKEEFVDKN